MIYLDYHATTPCDPQVIHAMLPYFEEAYGNPGSAHAPGHQAAAAVEKARRQVAALLNARPEEIIFTAGATESNMLAILGLANADDSGRMRIVTTPIEHKAVLLPFKQLQEQGYEVSMLPVGSGGLVDLDAAREQIDENTLLVSVQTANNEIGAIQPIAEIARLARRQGAFMHTDAAQAVGKIPINLDAWGIDLLSLSAHKFYGPKGVGALYVRGGVSAVPITPSMIGGGQESGLRSGTHNVPGIVGLGEACRLCREHLPQDAGRLASLRDLLESALMAAFPAIKRNGALDSRLPHNSSLTFTGIDSGSLMDRLPELAISAGAACKSGATEPSHILMAIGLSRQQANSTIRFGLGRFNTREEITTTIDLITKAVNKLK